MYITFQKQPDLRVFTYAWPFFGKHLSRPASKVRTLHEGSVSVGELAGRAHSLLVLILEPHSGLDTYTQQGVGGKSLPF